MSEANTQQPDKKSSAVRGRRERVPVLGPTFEAARESTATREVDRPAETTLIQRQCHCGRHTIGGGICETCRRQQQTGRSHQQPPDTAASAPPAGKPARLPGLQRQYRLSHIPPRTKNRTPESSPLARQTDNAPPLANRLAVATAARFARTHGRPPPRPGTLQRRSSGGVSVSRMRFKPRDIPADGKSTTQATVRYAGRVAGGAKLKWSIVGPAFGSAVDPNGVVTAGAAIKKGERKTRVKVKAEDSKHPGAHTFGRFNLWDADYLQAKKEYPKFRKLVLTKDPFTAGINGKFALEYEPRRRRLNATVRVSFTFKDDKVGAVKWKKRTQRAFERKFIRTVQNRWSNQYQFENVREPGTAQARIWKKLNPVRVRVRVKRDAKAPHFAITVHKKAVGAQVVAGTARFASSDVKAQVAFPKTGPAEVAALAAVTPSPIQFAAGKSDIKAADKKKLEFMATYLRRIKIPRFNVQITGHHQKVVHAPKASNAQKRADKRKARRLARQRAREVHNVLRSGGATFHRIRRNNVGDKGAAATPAWDKAVIASSIPKGWKNVQTTLEHEAGHMLGIGDEYVSGGTKVGDKTSHYALTMKAFGKQYADVQARRVADSASLMNGGKDIRPHHYVTLWDGLAQLTSAAALPKKPFTRADWKFRGET